MPDDDTTPATSPPRPPGRRTVLSRPDRADWTFVASALRTETVGGAILLAAAAVAIAWANSAYSDSYAALSEWVPFDVEDITVGPLAFGVDLTLATWAADGLLAIFFFVVGLELKRELLAGNLRRPAQAALPIVAAIGGMVLPAAVFLSVIATAGNLEDSAGWGVPVATDIAFALAVLAVLSTHLPSSLRIFLLTLAVVDDLLAITIIAVFYTEDLDPTYLVLALIPLGLFAALVQRRVTAWYLLIPLALLTWLFVHESGVHATVAGVLLGLSVPVTPPEQPGRCLAKRFEHLWRPVSAGIAVPIFAFFGAGVNLSPEGLREIVADSAAVGVALGLVIGKPIGVMGATWLVTHFTRAELAPDITWRDLWGLSFLTGIGFTVSLLVTELAFAGDDATIEHVRGGVIVGSLIAALLAVSVLYPRNRHYRRVQREEAETDEEAGQQDVPGAR